MTTAERIKAWRRQAETADTKARDLELEAGKLRIESRVLRAVIADLETDTDSAPKADPQGGDPNR